MPGFRGAALCKFLLPAWLISLMIGFALLQLHASTPEEQGPAPRMWPSSSRLSRRADCYTLVIFIHPYCPCSRATLGELSNLMERCRGRLDACVLFVLPRDEPVEWEQMEFWRTAASIPGVSIETDLDGCEAAAFGARTSGHALLFDREGALRFAGGITASRGHAGGNAGEDAIASWVLDGRAGDATTPTFGCALPVDVNTDQEIAP